jgi:HK97 family phage prohead protease
LFIGAHMNRAYSTIQVKAFSETGGKRTFSGIASTPNTDRMGDVIEPKGMKIRKDTPLLWQHDSHDPIGWVRSSKVTDEGIEVECEVAAIEEDGPLKDRLTSAWQMLKSKLVRGLSIGFNSVESARIEGTYGYRFIKTELLELSAVTIPANADCSITTIKSIDMQHLAALGREGSPPGDRTRPGASGQTKQAAPGRLFQSRSQKGNEMKTLKELRELRQTKAARLTELVELFKADDHEATEDETTEFDALTIEVKELDQDIRIAGFHAMQGAAAKGVDGSSAAAASASRGGMSFVKHTDPDDKFPGQSYVRSIIARAAAFASMKEGNYQSPADIAQHRWGKTHPKLVQYIRAAVAGGGTGSGEWGAELAQSDERFTGDFVTFLYSMTVFDRLPLRSVPARVNIKGQDGAATGYWVGESKGIPVSKPDFSSVELTPLKVGAIAVCSKELVADSSPSAELWIRDSIAQASAQRVDTTFLGAAAASAGVSPAGLLNGLSALAPSGADAAAVRADLMSLYSGFLTAKNASGLVQIMTPSMAKAISLMVNALGQTEFPNLNASGGTLLGDQVYTGDNVTPGDWILLKPSDIWKIGDGGVEVSMSDTAMVEQDDAPQGATDTPVAASATLVSLWQEESIGFKVVRRINYAKRRTSAVAVLSNAEYGGVVS